MVFVKTGDSPTYRQIGYYNQLRKEMGYEPYPAELLERTHTASELGAAIGDLEERLKAKTRKKFYK